MTFYRLDTTAPELIAWGKKLSPNARLRIARSTAEWAFRRAGGDDDSLLTQTNRDALVKIVEEYDIKYFDIYEANDDQFDDAGLALYWFRKARAVESLLYALSAKQEEFFFDALYEAQAAVGSVDELRAYLRTAV